MDPGLTGQDTPQVGLFFAGRVFFAGGTCDFFRFRIISKFRKQIKKTAGAAPEPKPAGGKCVPARPGRKIDSKQDPGLGTSPYTKPRSTMSKTELTLDV